MPSPDEVGAKHVYMIFHSTNIGMKEISYHSGSTPVQELKRKNRTKHAHAMDIGLMNFVILSEGNDVQVEI